MTATLMAAPSFSHDFLSPLPLEQCIDGPDSALVPQISDRQNLVHENSLEGDMYMSYYVIFNHIHMSGKKESWSCGALVGPVALWRLPDLLIEKALPPGQMSADVGRCRHIGSQVQVL